MRLQNVIAGSIGLVALLALSVAFLFEFQPKPRGTTLDEKVQAVLPKPNATPQARYQGTVKKLKDKEMKLAEIENDDDFKHLPGETREAGRAAFDGPPCGRSGDPRIRAQARIARRAISPSICRSASTYVSICSRSWFASGV